MPDTPFTYAGDSDMSAICKALPAGPGEDGAWDVHTEATRQIDRDLDTRWYRDAALQRGVDPGASPFDHALLTTATQYTRLGALKGLVLAMTYLDTGLDGSSWTALRKQFADDYEAELASVLAAGLDYDWDADDTLASDEKATVRVPRHLQRM